MIEHTEMQFIRRVRRLRDCGVVTPGILIQQRITRWVMCIVLVDEETTGECEEVGMFPSARIQEMHVAMFDRQAAKEDGGRLGLTDVTQQPGIITFSRLSIRDVLQINLQLVGNSLSAYRVQLSAADKE